MNYLDLESKAQIVSMLVDGCSIRAVERITGHHRDTIMRIGYRVGNACVDFHDAKFQDLRASNIQLDEAWSFVGKKQKNCSDKDGNWLGDQYIFIAMDADSKAILSYRIGKRTSLNTNTFIEDLKLRLRQGSKPQITSDGFVAYAEAVDLAFGHDVHYAQVQKEYKATYGYNPDRRYSPSYCASVSKKIICGSPEDKRITTSHIERQNLSLRMNQRRFTRLTNAFSKKLEHHMAAMGLYSAHYNFCRVHNTTRITPAMYLGLTDHIWTIGEILLALGPDVPMNRIKRLAEPLFH